jgi:carbamoyl-phosphate synthase large subunit
MAGGTELPSKGKAFISVRNQDKSYAVEVAKDLLALGFKMVATGGTLRVIEEAGIKCEMINKVQQGRPHIVDLIKNDDVDLIINTTEGSSAIADSFEIRRESLNHKIPYSTTINGGKAMCMAMAYSQELKAYKLQNIHKA